MNFIPQSWGDVVAIMSVIAVIIGIIKKMWLVHIENKVHNLANKVQGLLDILPLYATREVVNIKFENLERTVASIDAKMDILLRSNSARQSNS